MSAAADALMGIFGFKRAGSEMEDSKLIELAAKAAGIVLAYGRDVTGIHPSSVHYLSGPQWNPLTDDGDALRLAVALEITVEHGDKTAWAYSAAGFKGNADERYGDDAMQATRRAIVRAAAAIGEGLAPFPTAEQIREDWT